MLCLVKLETRVRAASAGQCAHIPFLLQVIRSQQFPRSPGVGASSTRSFAVSVEMMGRPCLPTVGLPCWWRKMAPSLRCVVIWGAGNGLGQRGCSLSFPDTPADPKMFREGEHLPTRPCPFTAPPHTHTPLVPQSCSQL